MILLRLILTLSKKNATDQIKSEYMTKIKTEPRLDLDPDQNLLVTKTNMKTSKRQLNSNKTLVLELLISNINNLM